jgi:hypothetical protein
MEIPRRGGGTRRRGTKSPGSKAARLQGTNTVTCRNVSSTNHIQRMVTRMARIADPSGAEDDGPKTTSRRYTRQGTDARKVRAAARSRPSLSAAEARSYILSDGPVRTVTASVACCFSAPRLAQSQVPAARFETGSLAAFVGRRHEMGCVWRGRIEIIDGVFPDIEEINYGSAREPLSTIPCLLIVSTVT